MSGLAKQIMGGGISFGAAKAINGSVATGISAAGTTQGTATSLNAAINVIGTAAASTGVILPSCEIADEVWVYNGGANTLTVYPDSSSQINAVSVNSGVSLGTNTAMMFKRITSTRWIAVLSA